MRDSLAPHPELVARRSPGVHVPSPVQSPALTQLHDVSQRVGIVPHIPHGVVPDPPGKHAPSPPHAPYTQTLVASQNRSWLPHIPHGTISAAPGVGQASEAQGPADSNTHVSPQTLSRVSPAAHPSELRTLVPGAHSPSPSQADVVSQTQLAVQRAICVPQLPHEIASEVPATHSPLSPSHGPFAHTRSAVQKRSRVPHAPHASVSSAPATSQGSGLASGASAASLGVSASSPPSSPPWVVPHPIMTRTARRRRTVG